MSAPLLSVKLKVPPHRSTLVLRPHLIEKLNVGLDGKLSLISAPAGYGKTTLLSSWAKCCQRPLAWISLDEGDNKPGRFLHYLSAALQQIQPTLNVTAQVRPGPWRATQVEAVLTSLLNEFAERSGDAVLILDDYHHINNQHVHNAVTFLLEHLPPQLHLAIASRSDPPLPIARLRAQGELLELRQNDLRFSADETTRFLTEFIRLPLSAADVDALVSRTEGWITGLQMAALSLQHQPDAAEFIAKFTGSQHHVLDYLIEEVLARQPAEVQAFLLQTSLLERMTGALCDTVIINPAPDAAETSAITRPSQTMLEQLEHANLFVLPLDENLRWYRYHVLFADCLQQRLYQTAPQLVPELHRRAADWYQRHSYVTEAINHLLAAGDWLEAAQLVERHGMQLFVQGDMATLVTWLEKLPDDLIRKRPWLCVLNAWVYVTGRHEGVESCVQAAEQAIDQQKLFPEHHTVTAEETPTENQLRAHLSIIRAVQAMAADDVRNASYFARQALEQHPGENYESALAAMILGWAAQLRGDLADASRSYATAERIGLAAGSTQTAISASCRLGDIQAWQGELHKAAESYQEALRFAAGIQAQSPAATGYAHMRLGDVYCEWNDLETALQQVVNGIELCQPGGYSTDWAVGFVTLARIHLARHQLVEARAALQNALRLTTVPMGNLGARYLLQDWQVRLWLADNDLGAVARWKDGSEPTVATEETFGQELERLTRARILIAQSQRRSGESDLTAAVGQLTRVLNLAESMGWCTRALQAMILQALVLQLQGQLDPALTVLTRALLLARPQGFARIFLDEGAPMIRLLRKVSKPDLAVEYAESLLAMADRSESVTQHSARAQSEVQILKHLGTPIEPLSVRELEVLRLLPTDLPSPTIASELGISANTVRSHIRHIYGKLGVNSRYQAVLRAKEYELI